MKKTSQELPWWFYIVLAAVAIGSGMLTLFGVFDFSPKPGVHRGLMTILIGLHEIFGPLGPPGAFGLIGTAFLFVARGARKRQRGNAE